VLDQLREDSAASIHSTIVSDLELVVSVRKAAFWISNRSRAERLHPADLKRFTQLSELLAGHY
jgi:Na+-transporting NADH:ubiquinone oxidoreductase subunit NqrF